MSKPSSSEVESLRTEKLPYQKNCVLMAIARTERKSSTQMLHELKRDAGIVKGSDLENENKFQPALSKLGYSTEGPKTWQTIQDQLKRTHKGSGVPKSSRYFAVIHAPGVDINKSTGHAVSLSVSRGGGVSIFANNSDRSQKGEWIGSGNAPHLMGGRPFQRSLSPEHQVQLYTRPSPKSGGRGN